MPPSLGQASGTITINAQLTQAANQLTQFSVTVTQTANQINRATTSMSGSFTRLAAAFGVGFGVSQLVSLGKQMAENAIEADKTATAYDRQRVAAESLAGS